MIPDDRICEEDFIEFTRGEQKIRLYIAPYIPEDTQFAPRTRKEISVGWPSERERERGQEGESHSNSLL